NGPAVIGVLLIGLFWATTDGDSELIAGVAGHEVEAEVSLGFDGVAIDGDDAVFGFPAGLGGGRARPDGGDFRGLRVGAAGLEADAKLAGDEVALGNPAVEVAEDVFEWDGEADAGVVELGAGDGA